MVINAEDNKIVFNMPVNGITFSQAPTPGTPALD